MIGEPCVAGEPSNAIVLRRKLVAATEPEWLTGRETVIRRLSEVEAQLAEAGRADILAPLILAEDVQEAWKALSTDKRRAVINTLMVVYLLPPGRGTRYSSQICSELTDREKNRFIETVVIDWRRG